MLTDNSVLVSNIRPTRTIFCIQRNAEKVEPTEETQVASNIASFGDDIGKTTNKVTAMYDVQSLYDEGSEEYRVLEYRIMSGQLYQQNCIDKIKGIVCNPMPAKWYDYHANALPEDATEKEIADREFNLRILADRKPYFMRYIYPTLMKQYNEYVKNTNTKCIREFRMTIDELLAIDPEDRTEDQNNFVSYYEKRLPVGVHNCVMNRICRRFEQEFDHISSSWKEEPFDYTIMRSEDEYTANQMNQIRKIYNAYNAWVKEVAMTIESSQRKRNRDVIDMNMAVTEFRKKCLSVCSTESTLMNVLLDICYAKSSTKKFAWDVCVSQIVRGLAEKHDNTITYPMRDPYGDIEFGGMKFSMQTVNIEQDIQEGDDYERDYIEREDMGEGSD